MNIKTVVLHLTINRRIHYEYTHIKRTNLQFFSYCSNDSPFYGEFELSFLSIGFLKSILNLIQDIVFEEFCIMLGDPGCAVTKELLH